MTTLSSLAVERKAATPVIGYGLCYVLFFALFATHFDIFAAERGFLPINTMFLFIGLCGAFVALVIAARDLAIVADGFGRAISTNLAPIFCFQLWIIAHVVMVARAPIDRPDIDFTQIFPMYQVAVLMFGMLLANLPGSRTLIVVAGRVAFLLLAGSVVLETMWPGILGSSAPRTGGFALNANVAAFNLTALLAMTLNFRKVRPTDIPMLVLGCVAVFATMSRSGLGQATFVALFYAGCHGMRSVASRKLSPLMGQVAMLVGLAATLVLFGQVIESSAAFENPEARARLDTLMFRGSSITEDPYRGVLADHYFYQIMERPLTGFGTGYTLNTAIFEAPLGAGPHDMYIRTWLDLGIAGLVTYCGFLLVVLVSLAFRGHLNGVVLLVLILEYGFFDHNASENKTALLLVGIALAQSTATRVQTLERPGRV